MGQSQGYYQGQYGGGVDPVGTALTAATGLTTGAVSAASDMTKSMMDAGQPMGKQHMGGRGFGFMTRRKHRKMRKSRKSHKKRSHRRR
jgi:hypothetical protein